MNTKSNELYPSFQKELQLLPWIIGLAFVVWFSSLATFSLGIDQENALLRTDERIWLSQGRWFIFFLNQYFYTQPIVYYFPNLVFILLASISYIFVLKSLNYNSDKKWAIIFSSVIFTSHPFWYFIAEFYTNLIPAGIGLICCSYAMYLASKNKSVLLQIALIMIAIGNYQSYLPVMASMYAILVINSILFQKNHIKIKWVIGKIIILLLATAGHYLLLEILYRIYETQPSYIAQFINPKRFLNDPLSVMGSILKGAFLSYTGNKNIYGNNIVFLGLLALVIFFAIAKKTSQIQQKFFFFIAISFLSVSPFLIQVASGGFFEIALRVSVGLPLVAWFLTFSAFTILEKQQAQRLLIGLIILSGLQFTYLNSKYTTIKQLTLTHDKLIAAQVFERISPFIHNDPNKEPYTLLVQGGLPYHAPYQGAPTTSLTGSFFSWDFGNPERIHNFMQILGYQGFNAYSYYKSVEIEKEFAAIYDEMPAWPAKDSIRLHQNFILIKFGEAKYYN